LGFPVVDVGEARYDCGSVLGCAVLPPSEAVVRG
jgi:hypothetical protein